MEEEKSENIISKENGEQNLPPIVPEKQPLSPTNKKTKHLVGILAGFIALILLLLVGVGMFKNVKVGKIGKAPPPDPENVLLATVGDKKIYRSDVKAIALEQYLASGISSQILKQSFGTAVERTILDKEAFDKKIVVEPGKTKVDYYQNLKDTIIARQIGSVTVNSIGFWVPALHDIYPQKPEYQQMRDLQATIFTKATNELKQGKTTYEIGKLILQEHPVYSNQLAVNSYIFSKVDDVSLMQKPVVYQYQVNESNKSYMDFLFSLNKGQIKAYSWPDGEGASLVQVVDKNVGTKVTYDVWLKDKEKSVVYNTDNINKL